ncbi:MAG: hypothetical protein WBC65_10355 [Ignavibacteria bacterium]
MISPKLSNLRSLLIWILVLSQVITVNSCMTTKTYKVESDALRADLSDFCKMNVPCSEVFFISLAKNDCKEYSLA